MFDPDRLIDITLPIRQDMLVYPGDPAPVVRRLSSIANGDSLTLSEVTLGCHVGTHVDAPAHFIAGAATVDQLDRRCFMGPATVLDLTGRTVVTEADVRGLTAHRERHLLLKTDNAAHLRSDRFPTAYCTVAPEAATALLAREPLSIGIDFYSLDPPSEDAFPAHLAVARQGRPVFVCLDLSGIAAGDYTFLAAALPVVGVEAMPVRAFLLPAADG